MQASLGPFRHGVASGDPLADRVVIWTRVTSDHDGDRPIRWTVARDRDLDDCVATGQGVARAEDDTTFRVDVIGLEAATPYWYAFDCDGERSTVGRTKTLPIGRVDHLRFAQCSCSKHNAGFFNAYARIADREDLDFVLHLGDYIYEAGEQPAAGQTPGAGIGRPFDPLNECVTLDDYRRRYAQYHHDPDAQRMHRTHPMIATVDDHEFADGAWRGGSDAHVPERDGPWEDRRAAAFRARAEWLPIRHPDPADPTRIFRSMALGDLADLYLIDTRSRRDQPVRGEATTHPGRSQLGREQADWLIEGVRASPSPWLFVGNGSVMSPIWRDGFTPSV
ncbi:MAG: alkaline phosphatase D family protein, partial [Candidatus Limnocylindria bacterium]